MGADLCSDAEHETPIRYIPEIPGKIGDDHRTLRERDRDSVCDADPAGTGRRHAQWQDRIMAKFGRDEAVISLGFKGRCDSRHVAKRRPDDIPVDLHGRVRFR